MNNVIFINIGRMRYYNGLKNDYIEDGGDFVKKNGYGHEMYNFRPHKGYMYGTGGVSIDLKRLGCDSNNDFIKGINVIWVAKSKKEGTCIIGWYKNATIYRNEQYLPFKNSNRKYKIRKTNKIINIPYKVKAKAKDCKLLPEDRRVFRIPRGKGGMGQRNIWYADKKTIKQKSFRKKVLRYINNEKNFNDVILSKSSMQIPRQYDIEKRLKVEKIAMTLIKKYYEHLGYSVDVVQKENLGWDLEAIKNSKESLKLEVKGLSGSDIFIEFTPNEYKQMKRNKDNYRICIVSNALIKKPNIYIFSYSSKYKKWLDDKEGTSLKIREIISARMFT